MHNRRISAFALLLLLLTLQPVYAAKRDTTITPADERTEQYLPLLNGKRVALIINQTAKVGAVSLLDLLISKHIDVRKIFVPEHGFRGNEDAGAHIDNSKDSLTGLPVISLYGAHKKPTADDLAGIDMLVYDLQDVGVRFYTYISTLEYCMEAAAENKVQIVVLDRPNPNGFYVDGPVLNKSCKSFVGMQSVPIVYGMTVGEYAKMLVGERWIANAADLKLTVIKCDNYNHNSLYRLPVAPSPNLRNMAAVYAYPSLCMFEGTVISVGRGTDKPFQQFGSPELKGKYTYSFTPHSGYGAKSPMYEDKECFGMAVGVTDEQALQEIDRKFQLKWVLAAYNAYPDKAKFFTPFFKKLAGTDKLDEQIKSGVAEADIRKSWAKDIAAFKKIRKKYLLYTDFK